MHCGGVLGMYCNCRTSSTLEYIFDFHFRFRKCLYETSKGLMRAQVTKLKLRLRHLVLSLIYNEKLT